MGRNLKKLKSLIRSVTPEHPSWKLGLNWTITTGGFIETLINFYHIREDLVKTKKEVDKFNEARSNLMAYKDEIEKLLKLKQSENLKQTNKNKQKSKYGISSRNPKKKSKTQLNLPTKIVSSLRKKLWDKEQQKERKEKNKKK